MTSTNPTFVPPFEPHPLLWNGHLQTVVPRYVSFRSARLDARYVEIGVGGGDRLAALDSTPDGWRPGRPAALLVHGLGSSARASYVVRLGVRLVRMGVRVVRMNLRGAGAGFGLARSFYHAGRTDDLRAVMGWLSGTAPGSPVALVGSSLGGNLVLKLAAEAADTPVPGLDCVVAANPPLDLADCCRSIRSRANRVYDRSFVRTLRSDTTRFEAEFPDLERAVFPKSMSVLDFDELYNAPRNGFRDAAHYYAESSAGPRIAAVRCPGLVVHSLDDPFIPAGPIRSIRFPENLALELIPHGGHLGYFSREPWDGDRRWLEARLAAWLTDRWSLGRPNERPS